MDTNELSIKQTVLVVDDTPENIAILSSLLRADYRIKVAISGALALEIAGSREDQPDLILLDIRMPDMNGYEVCRRLKESICLKDIPVIFLSALSEPEDKMKAFEVGGVDYITKPFYAEEVRVRVETHLKLRRLQMEYERQNHVLQDYNDQLRQLHTQKSQQQQDITDMQITQDELRHNARQDTLTGLANRTAFMIAIQYALDRKARRPEYAFAILFIDLDRFKTINDSLGHLVGDELFKGVAMRLLKCVRPTDFVARLGGDEFTVLLDDVDDDCLGVDTTKVAQRILSEISTPFEINGKLIRTTASIGIALSSTGYATPDDILCDADTAMYRAKNAGRGCFKMVDPAMHEKASQRLDLENDLRAAVAERQFVVYYQPIVALNDGRTCGFEALVRWNHPQKGVVPPNDFIPMAEETGLIVQIGNWVLREACLWIADINSKRDDRPLLTINVNVSPTQLRHSEFVEEARKVLIESDLPSGILHLEITEGIIVEHVDTVDQVLSQLKGLNIELQVDDFGTGYSSLAYLHRLPVDALKIDQSFVANMESNNESIEIIRAIIALAHGLKVSIVAEGVETAHQGELLQEMGCCFAQGYYFARPMTAEAAQAFLG